MLVLSFDKKQERPSKHILWSKTTICDRSGPRESLMKRDEWELAEGTFVILFGAKNHMPM